MALLQNPYTVFELVSTIVIMARYFFKFFVVLPLLIAFCALQYEIASASTIYRIAGTGIERDHYAALIGEISKLLAPELDVRPCEHSWGESGSLPAPERGVVDLAVGPSDFHLQYLQATDRQEISNYVQQFRVVIPLLLEEVHFVVKSDSPMRFIHEIANRKAYFGPAESRSELAAESIYRLLFYREAPLKVRFPIFSAEKQYRLALEALLKGELDVVVLVGSAPIPLLLDFVIRSQGEGLRLLEMDTEHPLSRKALRACPKLAIPKTAYPWQNQDVASLGSWTYLVCLNDWTKEHSEAVNSLVETWFRKLSLISGSHFRFLSHHPSEQIRLFPEDWQCYRSLRDFYARPAGEWYRTSGERQRR